MIRRIAAALLFVAASCRLSGSSEPSGGASPGTEIPLATPVGMPTGPATTRTIGPLGGTVVTPDGHVLVAAPPGTFSDPAELSITPISNRARGGVTQAYRIESSRPLLKAVTLTFEGPGGYPVGTGIQSLGVRYQDARGFWQPASDVALDPRSNSLVVSTSHLSDWTVVWEGGEGALSGTFTLDQRVGIPFQAAGIATLYQQTRYLPDQVYVVTGTITIPPELQVEGLTCTPDQQTQVLDLSIAEIDEARFRFGIPARWGLSCVDPVSGATSSRLLATSFDTMRIALTRCPGAYDPGQTQVNGTSAISGAYQITCSDGGTVSATWSFGSCPEGGTCALEDACRAGRVSCAQEAPACVDSGAVADGTPCADGKQCTAGVCGA